MFTTPDSDSTSGNNSSASNTSTQPRRFNPIRVTEIQHYPPTPLSSNSANIGKTTTPDPTQRNNRSLSIQNPPERIKIDMEQFKKEKHEILMSIEEDKLERLLAIRPNITKDYRIYVYFPPNVQAEVTIFFYAAIRSAKRIISYFIKNTTNLLDDKQLAILESIKNNKDPKGYLTNKSDVCFIDKDLRSPLYYAISINNKEIVNSLILIAPILLNLYIHGAPPLFYAISKGFSELAHVIFLHKKSALFKRDTHGNLSALQYAVNSKSSKMVAFIVQVLEEQTKEECSKYTKMQIVQLLEEQGIQENPIYTKSQFESDLLKAQEILNLAILNSENHFARMKKALGSSPTPQNNQSNQSNQNNVTILTSSSELMRQNSSHSETPRAPLTPKTPLSPFSPSSHHLRNSSSSIMNSRELGLNRSSEGIDNPTLQAPTNSPQQRPIDSPSSSLEDLSLQSEVEQLRRSLKNAQEELRVANERIQWLEQKNLHSIDEQSKLSMTPQFDNINASSPPNPNHAFSQKPQQHQVIKSSYRDRDRSKSTSLIGGLGGILSNIKGALSPTNPKK